MRTFLLWPRSSSRDVGRDPARVAAQLQSALAPLFQTPPVVCVRQTSALNLVLLSLPVSGWIPPFSEEDDHSWIAAVDYPVDAAAAMKADGTECRPGPLLALARGLQQNRRRLLQQLSPPFSLVWHDKDRGETYLQNDGLGQAQLLEYTDGEFWVLTNRVAALGALGLPLEPDAGEWAARLILGWFPLNTVGFKRITHLAPATQLRVDARGSVTRTTDDVLGSWIHQARLPLEDCFELARESVLRYIRAVSPLWEQSSVGLSGGYDSRAVVSSLRKAGSRFATYVKGQPGSEDVTIASQLAAIAGLELRVDRHSEMPALDAADMKRSVSLSLQWQAGLYDTEKYKTLFAAGKRLAPGIVRIMGQHGEIGRHYFHPRDKTVAMKMITRLDAARLETVLADGLMKRGPVFIRDDVSQRARELIRQAIRRAATPMLPRLGTLDVFYLYERTRRLNAGSLSTQTNLVLTPFLNPDYIRAVFAASQHDRDPEAFHRHIVQAHAPDWAAVPYESKSAPPEPGQCVNSPYYDSAQYWKATGKPLIDEMLAGDGFWLEVCDREQVRDAWIQAPDELAMLYMLPQALPQ